MVELRELARGIHPAALADGDLRALRGLARRSPVPVDLQVRVEGRLPEQVETATYFAVAEALTNTAKHAQATVVTIASTPPTSSVGPGERRRARWRGVRRRIAAYSG